MKTQPFSKKIADDPPCGAGGEPLRARGARSDRGDGAGLRELSPRELAVRFTDERQYFVSEVMVYRLLKVHDLITSPAYVVIKAADQFHTKATRNAKTKIFGDATGSAYTVIKGYTLVNASIGYRTPHWEVAVFARHLFDKDYMQNLTVQAGNSGLIVGTPSEPRLIGVTLRVRR